METQAHVLDKKGANRVSPFTVPMMIPNMATGLAAIALGAKGPSSAVATACGISFRVNGQFNHVSGPFAVSIFDRFLNAVVF